MGTRNLTLVKSKGKTKIAQYGQWDGYPSGQGATALNFLLNADLVKFTEKVDKLQFYTDAEINAMSVAEWSIKKWLSRDRGAEILELVYNDKAGKLMNKEAFAADSLFCEWAYVIDLDKNTFEVYEGFNQTPLEPSERFYGDGGAKNGYYPIRHVKTFSLSELPTEEQFLKELEPSEETEENEVL